MIATSNKLNHNFIPTYQLVPVTFGAKNLVIFEVEQEEWRYQKGQDSINVKMEDCLSWERLSKKATHCSTKCLPVGFQYLLEEKIDRPRCHNKSDHLCMFQFFYPEVCMILMIKFMFNSKVSHT